MSVVIEKMLVPESASNCPKQKLILVDGVIGGTIHGTGNFRIGTDARNQAGYQLTSDARARQVCCHGYVDDKVFVQTHQFDRIGWHAGDGCENPGTDYGCWSTLGIEGCESESVPLMGMLQTFADVLALIAIGDARFDWGDGHTKGKFSLEHLKQHIWVSQEVPPHDCPYKIRHMNLWAQFMTMIDASYAKATGITPPIVPVPPDVKLPTGMTLALAERLFGSTHDTNGARYSFNPDGARSKRWLEHGLQSIPAGGTWLEGTWPSIDSVYVEGSGGKGTKILQYSDGWLDDGKSKVA